MTLPNRQGARLVGQEGSVRIDTSRVSGVADPSEALPPWRLPVEKAPGRCSISLYGEAGRSVGRSAVAGHEERES